MLSEKQIKDNKLKHFWKKIISKRIIIAVIIGIILELAAIIIINLR